MERTILKHDKTNATARIRFAYKGVVIEQDYNLIDVVPGTRSTFAQFGLEFTEDLQHSAIEKITAHFREGVDAGWIQPAPKAELAPAKPLKAMLPENTGQQEPVVEETITNDTTE